MKITQLRTRGDRFYVDLPRDLQKTIRGIVCSPISDPFICLLHVNKALYLFCAFELSSKLTIKRMVLGGGAISIILKGISVDGYEFRLPVRGVSGISRASSILVDDQIGMFFELVPGFFKKRGSKNVSKNSRKLFEDVLGRTTEVIILHAGEVRAHTHDFGPLVPIL